MYEGGLGVGDEGSDMTQAMNGGGDSSLGDEIGAWWEVLEVLGMVNVRLVSLADVA